eukprot:110367-Chlamydomonas_euryale.AAC.1
MLRTGRPLMEERRRGERPSSGAHPAVDAAPGSMPMRHTNWAVHGRAAQVAAAIVGYEKLREHAYEAYQLGGALQAGSGCSCRFGV